MGKSARVLGQDYGLTSQEMNFVLKEEGFLDGEPGNYFVTEKGKKYAEEQDHSRGTGGYSWYNRAWTTRTWDDGVSDELDITDDRKEEIRQAMSIAKQKIKVPENEDLAIKSDIYSNDETDTEDSNIGKLVLDIGALLLAIYGCYKAYPYIKRWWNNKALPFLNKVKDKFTGKEEKAND